MIPKIILGNTCTCKSSECGKPIHSDKKNSLGEYWFIQRYLEALKIFLQLIYKDVLSQSLTKTKKRKFDKNSKKKVIIC